MSPEISPAILVEIGVAAQLNFKLKVAGPKETITVLEAPRSIEANPSSVSALVDERAIKDLPINGRRFTDLLLLMPGVTQDPRGLTSGSNGDLSYGGIRGYNNSFLIDGSDNNNGFYAQASGRYRSPYQFSDEVVQEFRVQSSGYGAESGRAGGAVVNIVTKSGTNQWHGSGFYYLRDSSWAARHRLWGLILTMCSINLGRRSEGRSNAARRSFLPAMTSIFLMCPAWWRSRTARRWRCSRGKTEYFGLRGLSSGDWGKRV